MRLRTFERICETVAFAHAHGVIHRDLKPENVMVGPFGEVLVHRLGGRAAAATAPWRTALRRRRPPEGPATGPSWARPGYMAPEQARGDVGAVDERADVYALGAILHHLLTDAAPPAEGACAGPRRLNRAVPRPLDSICLKALASAPGERYASVTALARDVSAFLSARPVAAHRETPLEWTARQAGRYRTPLLLVAVYLLVRSALIFWAR